MVIPFNTDIFGSGSRLPHGFQSSDVRLIRTIGGEEDGRVANIQFVLFPFNDAVVDATFGPPLAFIRPLPDLIFGQK